MYTNHIGDHAAKAVFNKPRMFTSYSFHLLKVAKKQYTVGF